MDSVLEVLGIFLRLFVAWGVALTSGVVVVVVAAYAGASDPAIWMLFGGASATVACALATWVWNG